jgi:hypothetical protein
MSHTVQIKTQFKKLPPLKTALRELGWELKENVRARERGGGSVHALVAVNPSTDYGATDLVIEKVGKEFEVRTSLDSDHANRILASLGGREMNKLKTKYVIASLKLKALENGDEVSVQELQNGTVKVKIHTY